MGDQATRDTREDAAANPKGPTKGNKPFSPKPTEIPDGTKDVDVRKPPSEVPPIGEHVPTRVPDTDDSTLDELS